MESASLVERVARTSYGRLVAILSRGTRDIAAAEDALSDAFVAALAQWPRTGAPANPEAWLVEVARKRYLSGQRRAAVAGAAREAIALLLDELGAMSATALPEARLSLLFVCAHPAIDAAMRTPLMLQTVLGLTAEQIGAAFLVSPAAMGQRLSRAKTKIRDAGLSFELPSGDELAPRLSEVLEAVYGAYAVGADDASGGELREEALALGRLIVQLLPAEPEARGLVALCLYAEARRPARLDGNGDYVPLSEQDPARWSPALHEEAEWQLREAFGALRPGRFQLEAAIQSAHMQRLRGLGVPWDAILGLYQRLREVWPTAGVEVAFASALHEATGDARAALAVLDALEPGAVKAMQTYWATRAHLLARAGEMAPAREAYTRALGLTGDEVVRRFLARRLLSVTG